MRTLIMIKDDDEEPQIKKIIEEYLKGVFIFIIQPAALMDRELTQEEKDFLSKATKGKIRFLSVKYNP